MQCPSCVLVAINGVLCHEMGCPDSHLFKFYECHECGQPFAPEYRGQQFCDSDCHAAYCGIVSDTLDRC
jgi:hypothetical protein